MLDMGNGQKFPMNIPAANFGISANSLPSLVSKNSEHTDNSPPSLAPAVAPSLDNAVVPASAPLQTPSLAPSMTPPQSTPQIPASLPQSSVTHPVSALPPPPAPMPKPQLIKESINEQLMPSPSAKQVLHYNVSTLYILIN